MIFGRADDPVQLSLPHRVYFVRKAFDPASPALLDVFGEADVSQRRVLVVVDQGLVEALPGLQREIEGYFRHHAEALPQLVGFRSLPGAEQVKNDLSLLESLLGEFDRLKLDRHSYVMVIGGGATLDMVGFAAAVAHRGLRLVRLPSTSLAQCDSGVGVKNSVNMFGKKNLIGTFAVPWAVVNDFDLLRTLSDRDWRGGLSEAVKVALLKSPALWDQIVRDADALAARDEALGEPIWQTSAELHYQHIVHGGDPFELTRSRPLDFGHWAAHKLEPLSQFALRHGEAVAIGLAVDVYYAAEVGLLDQDLADKIADLLSRLGFDLWCEQLRDDLLLDGLEEFREHLGGQLTVTLIRGVGKPVDVHEMDHAAVRAAIDKLAQRRAATGLTRHSGDSSDA
jgi:3-dehydroquinate synthase